MAKIIVFIMLLAIFGLAGCTGDGGGNSAINTAYGLTAWDFYL